MNELLVGIPITFAVVFSVYVYLSLRRIVKETTTLAAIRNPIYEKFRKLVGLVNEDWTAEAMGIIRLVESSKKTLAKTNPEIITFSSMLRQHTGSLGISAEPINPPKPEDFYRTAGRHLEAYLDAQYKGDKAEALKQMFGLQAFMATYE